MNKKNRTKYEKQTNNFRIFSDILKLDSFAFEDLEVAFDSDIEDIKYTLLNDHIAIVSIIGYAIDKFDNHKLITSVIYIVVEYKEVDDIKRYDALNKFEISMCDCLSDYKRFAKCVRLFFHMGKDISFEELRDIIS